MLFGIIIAMAMGVIVSIPALRVKDEFLVLLTIGFNMVIFGLMVTQKDLTGGRWGMVGIPRPFLIGFKFGTPLMNLPLVVFFFAITFAISWRITHSPFGRVLKAIRDDEYAARSLGKDIFRFKVLVFVIAAGLAAVSGSLYAHYHAYVEPRAFTVEESIFLLAIVVIGGSANPWGPLVGAALLIGIPELLTFMPGAESGIVSLSAIKVAIYGASLVFFMRFRPQGIMPEHIGIQKKSPPPVSLSSEQMYKILGLEKSSLNPGIDSVDEETLSITGLHKDFGGIKAVDNVSFELFKGNVTALIGPNGAGKTTIFNLITGFIKPDSGDIYLKGKNVTNLPAHKINHLGIARSFQEVRVFRGMSVLENVLLACGIQNGEKLGKLFFQPWKVAQEERENQKRAMGYLDFVGLSDKAQLLASDLAFAEQKLMVLACLLATRSDVLLIDELVSGIDPTSIDKILELIRKLASLGKTICIIEHNLDVVKDLADVTYFLAVGQVIASGSPEELMADPNLTEIYFGT
jgi:branched-chain amino acid transport system permease protein